MAESTVGLVHEADGLDVAMTRDHDNFRVDLWGGAPDVGALEQVPASVAAQHFYDPPCLRFSLDGSRVEEQE